MDSGGGEGPHAGAPTPLRLLLVEDYEDDALLIVRVLRRSGYAVTWERVETAAALTAALQRAAWDVVTCDWTMPSLAPMTAIELVRAHAPALPIVAVSGETREEIVVGALRAGARHFVGKTKLALLAPVIEAVLCDAQGRPRIPRRSATTGER